MTLWEVSVNEDHDPDGNGEECHPPLDIFLLPKHHVEAMGAPKGSDSVACEVNIDGGAYDGDENNGVKPG